MQRNVASQKIALIAYDATTGVPKTGDAANLTAYVSIDGAAESALGDSSASEIDATNLPGVYVWDLTQAETNGNMLIFGGKSSTANIKLDPLIVFTRPANFPALGIESDGHTHADVKEWLGVAPLALASQRVVSDLGAISGDSGAADNLEAAADGTGYNLGGGSVVAASVTAPVTLHGDYDAAKTAASQSSVNDIPTVAEFEARTIAAASYALEATALLVKAKTDNLPSDPADASDISASFASIASTLSTILGHIDTEIAAIKAKTDGLPSDPADQSALEALIDALPTAAEITTAVWAAATRTLTGNQGVKKNTALANFMFRMTDSTNHVPTSGLTVTAQRSLDGAAFANCTNAVSEVASGWYKINLAAGDLNGDTVALKFTATGADQLDISVVTAP